MRKYKDILLNISTYFSAFLGILMLFAILIYVFSKGTSLLSWDLIKGDYYERVTTCYLSEEITDVNFSYDASDEIYYSSRYGIGLKNSYNKTGEKVIEIVYIDAKSPLKNLMNSASNEYVNIMAGEQLSKIIGSTLDDELLIAIPKDGAAKVVKTLDKITNITTFQFVIEGGGIRGSLLTTIYLILLTLLIAIPLGVGAAVYLSIYAKGGKITQALRFMIDLTSGIPSIIFGLVGALVFIPFVDQAFGSKGGSILSGALTMCIILLPVIIKTTEESIKVIPKHYQDASLALGASMSQTTFKIIIPNALPGILTSVLLSIGRIIGESAALIYAVGTAIKDDVILTEKSTSLAVHIWTIMGGENPNYELACAISMIILIIVIILSILVKVISKRLNKLEGK